MYSSSSRLNVKNSTEMNYVLYSHAELIYFKNGRVISVVPRHVPTDRRIGKRSSGTRAGFSVCPEAIVSYGIGERDGVTWSGWLRKDEVGGEIGRQKREKIQL